MDIHFLVKWDSCSAWCLVALKPRLEYSFLEISLWNTSRLQKNNNLKSARYSLFFSNIREPIYQLLICWNNSSSLNA